MNLKFRPIIGGKIVTHGMPAYLHTKCIPRLVLHANPFASAPIGRREAAEKIREYRRLGRGRG